MKHPKNFNLFVNSCYENSQNVGLGNPNSNILFIGKEGGIDENEENFHGSAKTWLDGVDYSLRFIPEDEGLRNGNHTWQKYQKLYELILGNLNIEGIKHDNKEITFVENCFTTELNNLHAKSTTRAKKREGFKENLKLRKDIVLNSDFIQNFPIVLIFANDNKYIETYPGEVKSRFGVEFVDEIKISDNNKIWLHKANEDSEIFPKLVIHTRQLTNGASDRLIEKIAEITSEFIKENWIDIIVDKIENYVFHWQLINLHFSM